ncbi:hypothetical protein Acr_18g0002200 [Actinidia rufa]|uniref:NB-ARC domain-containing protein n=1 Tax=Actinidia rufa TaxID=165716 RepID=A0A7J0G5I1_9ERIC|nr:hypothetical protein Acr_18g0002200 [Actinidia rufa]
MMDSIKPTKEKSGLYAEEADIVGIEEPKRKLISWALDQRHPTCKVMFVVGMGGSGKTALVKKVFDSIKAEFDCHARITVSRSKEMPELLWDIFNQLSRPTAEPTPLSSSQFNKVYLLDKLSSHLQGKRQEMRTSVLFSKEQKQTLPCDKTRRLSIQKGGFSMSQEKFPVGRALFMFKSETPTPCRHKLDIPSNLQLLKVLHLEGFEISKKINRLRDLQKLSFVKAKKHLISSLGHLTQLRELGITDLSEADGPILCKSIQALQNLQSLNGAYERCQIGSLKLHDLVRIRLKWSRLTHDPIPRLQDLPNLLELQLLDAYTGTQLNFDAGKFQKLKILELEQLEDLEMVWLNSGSMPGLQKLTIRHCNKLKQVPKRSKIAVFAS